MRATPHSGCPQQTPRQQSRNLCRTSPCGENRLWQRGCTMESMRALSSADGLGTRFVSPEGLPATTETPRAPSAKDAQPVGCRTPPCSPPEWRASLRKDEGLFRVPHAHTTAAPAHGEA
ncbi:hypothetical protein TraAM80_10570 [Trypanosoma rangeli]|uniref:Uncharacterized protein n=1 Tax=Trypanosoma rangeli TaxID=5698 RepID=A0A3R7LWB4_TRYRA|nr:uncharacterized protein TraAM80_10570 [Trypanosoma rangeli]RNE94821.1 hypothetical protein TraAM80_10570 [Trypanosoma rangeli]|eukprot:RNE94821.1 hypothetical protein TraAM80_10570 [Trypanosoma rangeli]